MDTDIKGVIIKTLDGHRFEFAPVKHGRWIQNGEFDYTYKCSECGEVCPLTPDDESAFQYPYCANCGAKMDGEE